MVIWLGRENMVGGFLREDLGKVGILQWERDFRFHLFSGNNKFNCHNELGNDWRVQEGPSAVALEDPIDEAIVQ